MIAGPYGRRDDGFKLQRFFLNLGDPDPCECRKTGKREIIDGLEQSFWAWWTAYAEMAGLLRPKNYVPVGTDPRPRCCWR
jgi:hypothetical protein